MANFRFSNFCNTNRFTKIFYSEIIFMNYSRTKISQITVVYSYAIVEFSIRLVCFSSNSASVSLSVPNFYSKNRDTHCAGDGTIRILIYATFL